MKAAIGGLTMVTTNCQELAGVNCTVPLKGNSVQELQQNVFAHAQKDHADMCAQMTPQQQEQMKSKIESVYKEKSGAVSSR